MEGLEHIYPIEHDWTASRATDKFGRPGVQSMQGAKNGKSATVQWYTVTGRPVGPLADLGHRV